MTKFKVGDLVEILPKPLTSEGTFGWNLMMEEFVGMQFIIKELFTYEIGTSNYFEVLFEEFIRFGWSTKNIKLVKKATIDIEKIYKET